MEQSQAAKLKNRLCVGVILGILLLRFFPTIFFAKSLSKQFLIAHWDSLFFSLRSGQAVDVDPSLVVLHLPYRFLVAELWHHGIPLWNKLSGFGMPLLADPQAFVFSPLFALFFLIPSMYTWNITLIIELAVGAISLYFLCRELQFGCSAALISALLFTFCPYTQWQLELLGNGICLTPFVLLFFVRAARRQSLWHAALAGIASSIDILSAHPEVSFISITFASLFMGLIAYYDKNIAFDIKVVLKKLLLAGLIAFGLSAPMLIPFIEYLHNGHCYKLGSTAPADITWQSLILNYLFPYYKDGSPYLGPLSWLGLALAICFVKKLGRFALPILLSTGISFFAVARLFPLNFIFQMPLFSMVYPYYCLPEYLVLISMLAGLGLGCLINGFICRLNAQLIAALVLAASPLVVPAIISLSHYSKPEFCFYQIPASRFDWGIWLGNGAVFTAMIFVLRSTLHSPPRFKHIGSYTLIALGLANLIFISYHSLRIRPGFVYPRTLALKLANENQSRTIALGDHLFRPNGNLMCNLPSIQVYNPIFPKGFIEFIEACGAHTDEFSQYFTPSIGSLINVTGTGTILSQQPLLDLSATFTKSNNADATKLFNNPIKYANGLILENIELITDTNSHNVFCCLKATPNFPLDATCRLYLDIKDVDSKLVSFFTEAQPISSLFGKQYITGSAEIPKNIKHWTTSIRIVSESSSQVIRPVSIPIGIITSDGSWQCADSDKTWLFGTVNSNRFSLLSSLYGGKQLVAGPAAYENKSAFNRPYFVSQVKWVAKQNEALAYLRDHANDLSNVVVLEEPQRQLFEYLLDKLKLANKVTNPALLAKSAQINNLNHSSPISEALQVDCTKPALLVVSDLFYPGWKTYLDNVDWPMFRGNYLFRVILVPQGVHQIRFEYQPLSLTIGVLLFLSTAAVLLIVKLKFHRS